MQAELKRNLLIRTGSGPDRHRELDGLEVEKQRRQWIRCQIGGSGFGIEEHLIVERMFLDAQLTVVEQIVRNIEEIIDPGFGKLAYLGC